MMINIKAFGIIFTILAVAFLPCCDYVNGMVDKLTFPNAPVPEGAEIIGKTTEKTTGADKKTIYKTTTHFLKTDLDSAQLLEFYKSEMDNVRIVDLGGYYCVFYTPEGWEKGERIEINLPRPPCPSPDVFEVRQFRK